MSLSRRTPLRSISARKLARSKRVDPTDATSCRWCARPAEIGGFCGGCAKDAADIALKRFVVKRDRRCVKCGTEYGLTLAHIIPRGRDYKLRWAELNVVAACWPCHSDLDAHPDAKVEFFERLFPGRHEQLREIARRGPRPDVAAILARYLGRAA